LCKHLFCLMMHVLNYFLFLYFRHNLYERQNFSNTTTSRCKLCKLGFFQYIFYQYSIIWIQLTCNFFNFIIRWSILGSTFLSKSLCIQWYIYQNDIFMIYLFIKKPLYTMIFKKLFNIFELIWNLIFPSSVRFKNPKWVIFNGRQEFLYLRFIPVSLVSSWHLLSKHWW